MHAARKPLDVQTDQYAPASDAEPAIDMRFRTLLGAADWARLPRPVQRRFSKHLGPGQSAVYSGVIVGCRMRMAGTLLAQLCRVIGAPLPLSRHIGGAAVVSVTEDTASGGQVWARAYSRPQGFPQVIHSAKRFDGPTGLEEHLGFGFGIALSVRATEAALHFESDHYFWNMGGLRLRLPGWLTPGRLEIVHEEVGGGAFTFSLRLAHHLFGTIIEQIGLFHDREGNAS